MASVAGKVEKKLHSILEELYPDDWNYVGDWSFVTASKNPDFVNVNGKKQIIELFDDYWHKGENPQDRIDLFGEFGYRTLVIWERELRDEAELVCKIQEFVG